jgi:hypothetical protein
LDLTASLFDSLGAMLSIWGRDLRAKFTRVWLLASRVP